MVQDTGMSVSPQLYPAAVTQDSLTEIKNVFSGLHLPRVDFELASLSELPRAQVLRSRKPSTRTIREKLANALEGPWAPATVDLPAANPYEGLRREFKAFRESASSTSSLSQRLQVEREIENSKDVRTISAWSSVYNYHVPIRNLPPQLHGLTILHLSDIHFLSSHDRPCREMGNLAKYLETSGKRVDIILLSGDVITKSPEDLCPVALRNLARLSALCPQAFMVHGNHDYHGHRPALISRQLEKVGFHDINNHHIRLTISNAPLNIYGVDDAYYGRPTAPMNVSPQETNIVLTHNLDAIRGDFPKDVDLILSGHTHWGEFRFFDGSRLMNLWGYCDNINRHTKGWATMTDRSLSFVHPGLARYYVPYRGLRHPPGAVIHTLGHRP